MSSHLIVACAVAITTTLGIRTFDNALYDKSRIFASETNKKRTEYRKEIFIFNNEVHGEVR